MIWRSCTSSRKNIIILSRLVFIFMLYNAPRFKRELETQHISILIIDYTHILKYQFV